MKLISKRMRQAAADERGMTLMEVIVAIAIMTTIALAAASVSLNGTKTESAMYAIYDGRSNCQPASRIPIISAVKAISSD